jgi:hypothetical protein
MEYRARYYDPITGKFLSEDLLGTKEEGPNLYIYTGNNPATNEDPLGRFTIDPSCKGRCHKFGGGGDQPQNLEQVIQQQTDLACSNLQGMVDAKWRSCVQQSCKKRKIKCKGADDKSCQGAGGYGGKTLLILTGRTANLCPDNWSEPTPLEYVGAAVIHEWAHGCGYNTGPGVPYPDKPKRSR